MMIGEGPQITYEYTPPVDADVLEHGTKRITPDVVRIGPRSYLEPGQLSIEVQGRRTSPSGIRGQRASIQYTEGGLFAEEPTAANSPAWLREMIDEVHRFEDKRTAPEGR